MGVRGWNKGHDEMQVGKISRPDGKLSQTLAAGRLLISVILRSRPPSRLMRSVPSPYATISGVLVLGLAYGVNVTNWPEQSPRIFRRRPIGGSAFLFNLFGHNPERTGGVYKLF
jgi:hypothetical protein